MDDIAVLIPVYNEERTIGKVIEDFSKVLPKNSHIYVYDNNSTDNSFVIAQDTNKAICRKEQNQGKGNVIRRMFREVDASIYVIVDADNTYNPNDLIRIIGPIQNNNVDMVVGDRLSSSYFVENKRMFHNFGNVLMKRLVNFFFYSNIKDVMTGYRAFSRRFVKTFPCLSKGFEVETEMTIHAIDKNLNIENVIVDYKDRPMGSYSKLNTITDGISCFFTFVKFFILYRPLMFFGLVAIILFTIATILICPIFIEYGKTRLVPRFPTLMGSIFIYTIAVQSFFTGLILEILNNNNRQEFEYKLIEQGSI